MSVLRPCARASAIQESATLAVTAKVAELKRQGKDVISLGAGEPDFPTPAPMAQAGIHAIQTGNTRYTAAAGTTELRAAAATWLSTQLGTPYAPDEVMVTAGAKPALHMALMTLVERGDKVLIPSPYWVSYPDLVRIADGVPVAVPPQPDQEFLPTGAQIDQWCKQHRAKGIILNYPNNPSGANPTRAQMAEIVAAAVANDIWILSDEIYFALLYDGSTHVSPASVPGGRERTVVVCGGTKSHSLTGWRVGFLAAPAEIVATAGRVQSQVIGNPCTISQQAALAACRWDARAEIAMRVKAFDERRRFLVRELNGIPGLKLSPPKGAFYALVDVRVLCQKLGCTDIQIATRLLDEHSLAVMPGSAFAIPGFVRLSYAASMQDLGAAVERIRNFVARID